MSDPCPPHLPSSATAPRGTETVARGIRHSGRRLVGVAALGLALGLAACQPYAFKGTEYLDPAPAPDFELVRADGGTLRLSDLRDRVVLLFFGFTSCPDVCPTTLSDAAKILEELGPEAGETEYLFVTVDPDRDLPDVLRSYTGRFDPAIVGLTGSADALAQAWSDYGIYVEKVPLEDSSLDYSVTHTARVFVIDPDGRLRLSYGYGTPFEDILEDVRHLIPG